MANLETVEREYKNVQGDLRTVGDNLKKYHDQTEEGRKELNARLTAVEQALVNEDRGNPLAGYFGGAHSQGFAAMACANLDDNAAYQALADWNQGTCRLKLNASVKAALTSDGGSSNGSYPTQSERGIITTGGQRALRLLDVLPSRKTTSDAVEFVQVSAPEDAAEQLLEGATKQELNTTGELVRAEIATIAGFTSASRQVLSDNSQLQAAVDRMIKYKLLTKLESLLVNSTPATGKIDGLINQSTLLIPAIAATKADAIGEALVRQANAGFMPNVILMNSLDWLKIQLSKEATTGNYIFGSPSMPVPPALWNAQVVASPVCPEGTALTMDTGLITVLDREQPQILLSNSHEDYFTRNLIAILGELRAGLEVLDVGAIYQIDLSNSALA